MIIKFKTDIKTIRKAFAIIGADIPSDEELNGKLSNAEVDLTKINDSDMKQAELALVLLAIGTVFENETT